MADTLDRALTSSSRSWTRALSLVCGVGAVIAMVAGIYWWIGVQRVSARLDAIRDRGEPASVDEIEIDATLPHSGLHERAQRFHAVVDAAVDIDASVDRPEEGLERLARWPAGGVVMPYAERLVRCASKLTLEERQRLGWVNLIRSCQDPRRVDELTGCEQLGIETLERLREPCVPAAFELCALPPESGATLVHMWEHPDASMPGTDLFALASAVRILIHTIPARVRAEDAQGAMRRIEAALHGAESIRRVPLVAGHRTWLACVLQAFVGCRLVLASNAQQPDWSSILSELDRMDPRANLERTLIGERAFQIAAFDAARDGTAGNRLADIGLVASTSWVTRSYDLAVTLDAFEEAIALSQASNWMPSRGSPNSHRGDGGIPKWAVLSNYFVPDFERDRAYTLSLEAELLLARAAVAASREGAEAGLRLAAASHDPFDGRPLRARVEDHVLVLWSIGPDQVDDGASTDMEFKPQVAPTFTGENDIVWRVRVR